MLNRLSSRLPSLVKTLAYGSFAGIFFLGAALSPAWGATLPHITALSVTSGTVDTDVTITGTNFGTSQETSIVAFNGTTAPVSSWSASSISVTVPGGASTGNVIVTVGGEASNGVEFTIEPLAGLPTRASVITAINDVNTYWLTNNPTEISDGNGQKNYWPAAVYFIGDMAAYDATGTTSYLNAATTWASNYGYNIDGGNTNTDANAQAAGQVYIRLYQISNTASDIAGITTDINNMVNGHGFFGNPVNYWTWTDAIFMSMPDFAELGAIDNNTAYYTEMYSLYQYTKDTIGLYDTANSLWWENSKYVKTTTHWSRANGWAFAAHAKVLSVLPKSDSHYAEYLSTFTAMAKELAKVQQSEGYWNADLTGTDYAGPESSGTSFFLYGFAWGMNNGVLDSATYLPVVKNAWNFLANTAIQPSGLLGYVQPAGSAPGATTATTTEDFGVGAFLMAARQMTLLTQ